MRLTTKTAALAAAGTVALIAILASAALTSGLGSSGTTTTSAPPVVKSAELVVDGTVMPTERAEFSFPVAGRIAEVTVDEGDTVTAGRLLVRLDDTAATAGVAAAEADVTTAEAGVRQAAAAVDAGRATVDKAKAARNGVSDGAAKWRIDAADADVSLAEAQLRAADADAAAADARLAAARAAADQARAALDQLTITPPFAGTVTEVRVKVGDQVGPGQVAVRVADLTAWQVLTTDLDEAFVAAVTEGDAALLAFDALPGLAMTGTVTAVGLVGQPYQGTVVYQVTVVPDGEVEGLRWGMTATVTFPAAAG